MPRSGLLPVGLLVVDKPAGLTSRRVVDAVQRRAAPAKVGHAGTLDPLATGVLVVCLGSATRLIPFVQDRSKVYRAEFLLGLRSDTDDVDGRVERVADAKAVPDAAIVEALRGFVGDIAQVPPRFSAVHVEGRRAYDLARRGRDFDLEPKTVHVERVDLLARDGERLTVEIECGSGTYVRSIGRDLGDLLGCGAVMSALVRTRVGPFSLADAVPWRDVETLPLDELARRILPPLRAVANLPQHVCSPPDVADLVAGRTIASKDSHREATPVAAVDAKGDLVAVTESRGDRLRPRHVFVRHDEPRPAT